jgi:citrate lyase subunit beta/citryl-CoA lyase
LHVLIETPKALHEVWSIAAHPAVRVLDFGLLDFMSEHNGSIPEACMRSPGQFEHALLRRAKAEICAAAAAHGKVAAHNITTDVSNPEAAFQDARRARDEFGFLRMWSIHPSQVEPILRAMVPEFSQVARAGAILLAARKSSWGPIRFEGQLHDRASYRYLWALLKRARQFNVALPGDVLEAFF